MQWDVERLRWHGRGMEGGQGGSGALGEGQGRVVSQGCSAGHARCHAGQGGLLGEGRGGAMQPRRLEVLVDQ